MIFDDFNYWFLPEIVLAFFACVMLVVDQIFVKRKAASAKVADMQLYAVVILIFAAGIGVIGASHAPAVFMNGMLVHDLLSSIMKVVFCVFTAIVLIYSESYSIQRGMNRGEYYVLALFGVLGMMVMASAAHLLVLYMGLELMSLCLYAMVAFQRDSSHATEAAMKYFVLGAIASGCLLYGMSILYGLTGSLYIAEIQQVLVSMSADNVALIFALVFVVVALVFKLGAAPFHMWVPDVYHGAPTSTTLYLSVAPKLAAFAMLIRLLIGGLENLHEAWQDMLIIIALLSIIVGNVTAIVQTNLKRMLAYSTIAHMGYLLLGILSATAEGYAASLFYALVYAVMSMGAFGMIVLFAREGYESDKISDLQGLNSRNPWMAFFMLLLMFSLAGVPPTVGFYAKFAVIQALVDAGLIWVAVVAVVFAVVGAFYYLRVIKVMYFDEAIEPGQKFGAPIESMALISVNAIALIAILPWVGDILALCKQAIEGLA